MFNPAHIHLLLNHVPILGIFFGVLLLSHALIRSNPHVMGVALVVFVVAGLAAIPTFLTGEPAEEIVEEMPSVSHRAIEDHEDSAKPALAAAIVLGIVSLGGLWLTLRRGGAPSWLGVSLLVLSLVAAGLMARTGHLGGLIRHPEILGAAPGDTELEDHD
ncbi:MAG TPA: hypothetical protein VFP98_00965 [Candidatus Polarisedimenticolia bacterium]|nr:hypothetical protein [Candidatus Polarisedimenticolia bacterium]